MDAESCVDGVMSEERMTLRWVRVLAPRREGKGKLEAISLLVVSNITTRRDYLSLSKGTFFINH